MKNRTGRASEKEILIQKINTCLAKVKSSEDFLKLLKENNLRPYERGGKLTGVWYENRKYRFKRLGIDGIGKMISREKGLENIREKNKKKTREITR
ncbi:MAG: hypothetical protein HY841_08815 [Bacteroidetes bacterium]|nr:hypothetical protein [Bacteroidota bacterium]